MVNVQSVKQLVMAEVAKNRDLPLYDKIIIGTVAYMQYRIAAITNTTITTTMNSAITSQVNNVTQDLMDKKENFASYSVLKNYVIGLNKNNLLVLSESEMETIKDKFDRSDLKKPFSTKVFDTEMYNVSSVPYHLQHRLQNIHFTIMVPIIQYYHDRFGIPIENMTIYSADEVASNPGKVITFAIGEISPGTIINDMRARLFGIENKLYSYSLKNELVRIVIK